MRSGFIIENVPRRGDESPNTKSSYASQILSSAIPADGLEHPFPVRDRVDVSSVVHGLALPSVKHA